MKKLKISLVAVVAICLAIGGSAFTVVHTAPKTVDAWFMYAGSGSKTDPANYNYTGATAPCTAHVKFCAFKGIRQAAPNDQLPTQASVNSASSSSSNFTVEVSNLVNFQP